jgi:cysteinyl-tRNA synthetase
MMDFTWDAMAAADHKVRQLRQRMAGWAETPTTELSDAAGALDGRFRAAVANDLDMPAAVVVLNEAVSADVSDGEKFALLDSWDAVLGLDLGRAAREGFEITEEVAALIGERDAAREAKDFSTSDAIRDRLQEMGLEVMDTPSGTKVRPDA